MVIPNWCCMYKLAGESSGHLLIYYPMVNAIWNFMMIRFGISWVQPETLKCLFACWPNQALRDRSQTGALMWRLIRQPFVGLYGKTVTEEFLKDLPVPSGRLLMQPCQRSMMGCLPPPASMFHLTDLGFSIERLIFLGTREGSIP